MQIQSIKIDGYGALYGKHGFELSNRGLTLVLGDNQDEPRMNSNGAGKSTVFDALDWCLFGVVPRGDHVDSIIHYQAKKAKVTTTIIADDGQALVVMRARSKGKTELKLSVGGNDITAMDTKETQRLIEGQLGLDRDVFHATVLYGQTDMYHFAEASDAERMEMLSKILNLGDIDVYLERVKAEGKLLKTRAEEWEARRQYVTGQIAGAQDKLESYGRAAQQWEDERARKLQELTATLNEHLAGMQSYQEHGAQVPQLQERLASAQAQLAALGQADYSQLDAAISDLDAKFRDAQREHMGKRVLRQSLESELAKFQSLESSCPTCGAPMDTAHADAEIIRIQSELADAEAAEQSNLQISRSWNEELSAAREKRKAAETAWRDSTAAASGTMTEATSLLNAAMQAASYAAQQASHAEGLQVEMAKLHESQNPWHGQAAQAESDIRAMQADVQEAESTLSGISEAQQYCKFWQEGFGPKGLRSYILDSRLQELTDAVNYWVRLLTGGTLWIQFDTQAQARGTRKLRNSLNIRIFRYNPDGTVTERNYASWSGGEKRRVSWAIDFGLSRLVARRALKHYDLLILDEVFNHVDEAGGEALVEMLNHLKAERSSIFVIEHDAAFQRHFENRITVRKTNGRSVIVEETDDSEKKPAGKKSSKRVSRRTPVRRSGREANAG